jgi:epoxyqueuosine reductase
MKESVRQYAYSLGFDLVGFATRHDLEEQQNIFRDLKPGLSFGDMEYLRCFDSRHAKLLAKVPNCRSIIVTALNYYQPSASRIPRGPSGRVARYAWGRDYHAVLAEKLRELGDHLVRLVPDSKFEICVDSSALMEKHLAVRAGLGFQGKNTLLISERFGSWVVLGELLTSIAFEPDPSGKGDCRTCRECVDACPTGALGDGYRLEPEKCLAYHTIESKAEDFPGELRKQLGERVFGCDACLEACPMNQDAPRHGHPEFEVDKGAGERIDLENVQKIQHQKEFGRFFSGTPLARLGLKRLARNAGIFSAGKKIKAAEIA